MAQKPLPLTKEEHASLLYEVLKNIQLHEYLDRLYDVHAKVWQLYAKRGAQLMKERLHREAEAPSQ